MKKLIPALCLLLASAAMLGTASYAWFSMNQIVQATGMKVSVNAEAGIVIADATTKEYGAMASASNNSVYSLYPTSTKDCVNWTHNTSSNPSSVYTGAAYEDLSASDISGNDYIAKYRFYIRSSGAETLTTTSLDIKSVALTNSVDQNLTKALRVGIVFGGNTYIYAPVDGYTTTYKYKNTGDNVTVYSGNTVNKNTSVTSIPGNTADGIQVDIMIWYEGEDAACISDNIVTNLGTNALAIEFTYSVD